MQNIAGKPVLDMTFEEARAVREFLNFLDEEFVELPLEELLDNFPFEVHRDDFTKGIEKHYTVQIHH